MYRYTYNNETIGTGATALDAAIDAQDTIKARGLNISVEADCELAPQSRIEADAPDRWTGFCRCCGADTVDDECVEGCC